MLLLRVTNIDWTDLNSQSFVLGWIFLWTALCSLPFKQWALSSNTKEKGQTCCCIQSHSCGQGKGGLRECLLDLQWKVNEQRSWAKLFFFWPASSSDLFFVASIRMDGRRGDLHGREELWWKLAMSTLPFTGSFHPWQVQIIFGTSNNMLEKNNCYATTFYEISFTLIADLLCYAICRIVIVSLTGIKKNWRVSLLFVVETLFYIKLWVLLHGFPCDFNSQGNFCMYLNQYDLLYLRQNMSDGLKIQ